MFDEFMDYAKTLDVERNDEWLSSFKDLLKTEIKAHIADQVFAEEGLYRVLFSTDEMVLRAAQEIERDGASDNPSAMNEKDNK